MGVMACSREGCEHIMCRLYSRRFGYICWNCFEELQHFIKDNGGIVTHELIKKFMQTERYFPIPDPIEQIYKDLCTEFWSE